MLKEAALWEEQFRRQEERKKSCIHIIPPVVFSRQIWDLKLKKVTWLSYEDWGLHAYRTLSKVISADMVSK